MNFKGAVWRECPAVHLIKIWYHSFYLCDTGVGGWSFYVPLFCFLFSSPVWLMFIPYTLSLEWLLEFSFPMRFQSKATEMLNLVWIMYKMLWEAKLQGETEPVCAVTVGSRHSLSGGPLHVLYIGFFCIALYCINFFFFFNPGWGKVNFPSLSRTHHSQTSCHEYCGHSSVKQRLSLLIVVFHLALANWNSVLGDNTWEMANWSFIVFL